jgi:hypothetical protein
MFSSRIRCASLVAASNAALASNCRLPHLQLRLEAAMFLPRKKGSGLPVDGEADEGVCAIRWPLARPGPGD